MRLGRVYLSGPAASVVAGAGAQRDSEGRGSDAGAGSDPSRRGGGALFAAGGRLFGEERRPVTLIEAVAERARRHPGGRPSGGVASAQGRSTSRGAAAGAASDAVSRRPSRMSSQPAISITAPQAR